MSLWRRKQNQAGAPAPGASPNSAPAAAVAGLLRGERVLATAQEDGGGHWLVLTTWRLLERTEDGTTILDRPWHEVDAGTWDPDLWALSVLFVDGLDGRQWVLMKRTGPGSVPEVLRERTTASVALIRPIDLGPRRTARISIRIDLQTRETIEQVILGRGSRADDAQLADQIRTARREVRDQVGLPPEPRADGAGSGVERI